MSAAQFIERLYGELPALFKDEDELRALWSEPQTRRKLLERGHRIIVHNKNARHDLDI